MACWWLGGAVRCGVARWIRAAGVRLCRPGWRVRWVSAGLPCLGACALVPCPLGILAPSPGCCGHVLFLFCCLCGGPCCGWGGRLAVRAWWWAARQCSQRLPWWVWPLFPVWVCPLSPARRPVVGRREPVRREVGALAACLGGRAPPEVAQCQLGVGRCWSLCCGVPFLCVRTGAHSCALSLHATAPGPSPSWPVGGFLSPCCVAPGALSLWAPACYLGPLLAPLPKCPSPSLALPLPLPFPFPVWWWWGGGGGLWGADGPYLGVGRLEPPAEGFGGVGVAEALDRVLEEGFPCRLRHDGILGGFVGVGGAAGADLLESVHHVHPFPPSRSPGPIHPAAELPQSGGRPPSEVGRGPGGGLRARGPGAVVAGAGGGGCVRATGGTRSSSLFIG